MTPSAPQVTRYVVTVDGIGYAMQGGQSAEDLMGEVRDAVRDGAEWVTVPVLSGRRRVLVTANSTACSEQWTESQELDYVVEDVRIFPAFDDFV